MKRIAFMAVGLFYSIGAFSAEFDFSILGHSDMKVGHLQRCLKAGWKSASPTDAQNTQARSILESARTVLDSRMEVIKKDKEDLMAAWAASPIVPADVEKAESKLRMDFEPIRNQVRGDVINVLNLLSVDQKKEFNTSFRTCLKTSREEPRTGEPTTSVPSTTVPRTETPTTPTTPTTSTPSTPSSSPSSPSTGY